MEDLVDGWAQMGDALQDYQEAEDYADGAVGEVFASPILEDRIGAVSEKYRFPLSSIPIETLADRVEVRSVFADDTEADAVIGVITSANQLDVRIQDALIKAFTFGDSYILVWPVDQDPDGPGIRSMRMAEAGVEVNTIGPKHCRMFYDDESERTPTYAIKRWSVRVRDGKVWRVDMYYPGVVERWRSKTGEDPSNPESWLPYDDDGEDWQFPTPTPDEIPIFHLRTGMPYGRPVHEKAFGCQNATTKMLVTQIDTTDSHGWPQRWALIDAGAELDNSEDDPDWEDDADAADSGSIQGGVGSSGRSGPGTVQRFTGTSEVGQFAAADPAVFLDPTELFVRLMAQLTRTPLHYFDPSGGTPSGESLKVADAPLVKRAQRMHSLLAAPLEEMWDLCLRLRGIDLGRPVAINWAPAQTAVGVSDWEEVRARQDAGVPVPVTLVEAGYDPDVVEGWDLPDHSDTGGVTGRPIVVPAPLPPDPEPDGEGG